MTFQVILVNAITHNVEIIYTSPQLADAISYMNKYVDENYDLDTWIKAYHENKQSISIYQYFRVWSKQLIHKIHIVEFSDLFN